MNEGVNKKPVIITIVLFVLVIVFSVGFFIYSSSRFKVNSVSPSLKGKVPTSLTISQITLSQDLQTSGQELFDSRHDPQGIIQKIIVYDNKIDVYFSFLRAKQNYEFSIGEVVSVKNKTMNRLSFKFTAEYIPEKDMPREEITEQINRTQDKSESVTNPILGILPHSTLNYKIEAYYNSEVEQSPEKVGLLITVYLSEADRRGGTDAAIAAYRQEALDYVRSRGFNPSSFVISYQVQ